MTPGSLVALAQTASPPTIDDEDGLMQLDVIDYASPPLVDSPYFDPLPMPRRAQPPPLPPRRARRPALGIYTASVSVVAVLATVVAVIAVLRPPRTRAPSASASARDATPTRAPAIVAAAAPATVAIAPRAARVITLPQLHITGSARTASPEVVPPPQQAIPAVAAALPVTPAREDLRLAFERVRPAVLACAAGRGGSAIVEATVHPTGRVGFAQVSGDLGPTVVGSCIARAARDVRTSPFSGPSVTVSYPFALAAAAGNER